MCPRSVSVDDGSPLGRFYLDGKRVKIWEYAFCQLLDCEQPGGILGNQLLALTWVCTTLDDRWSDPDVEDDFFEHLTTIDRWQMDLMLHRIANIEMPGGLDNLEAKLDRPWWFLAPKQVKTPTSIVYGLPNLEDVEPEEHGYHDLELLAGPRSAKLNTSDAAEVNVHLDGKPLTRTRIPVNYDKLEDVVENLGGNVVDGGLGLLAFRDGIINLALLACHDNVDGLVCRREGSDGFGPLAFHQGGDCAGHVVA